MGKNWIAAAAAIVATTAVAGCGGSDGSSTTTASTADAAAFRQAAHRICTDAVGRIAALRLSAKITAAQNTAYAHRRRAIQQAALRRLSDLDVPSDAQTTFDQLLQTLEARGATMESAQIKVGSTGDKSVSADFAAYDKQQPKLDDETGQLRLAGCNWR